MSSSRGGRLLAIAALGGFSVFVCSGGLSRIFQSPQSRRDSAKPADTARPATQIAPRERAPAEPGPLKKSLLDAAAALDAGAKSLRDSDPKPSSQPPEVPTKEPTQSQGNTLQSSPTPDGADAQTTSDLENAASAPQNKLKATVSFDNTRFEGARYEVTNQNAFHWTNVRFKFKSGKEEFEYRMNEVIAGGTYQLLARRFVDERGGIASYDQIRSLPDRFSIECVEGTWTKELKAPATASFSTRQSPPARNEPQSIANGMPQKLATLNAGRYIADSDPSVTSFRRILDSLKTKCPGESDQTAGDRLVAGWNLLKKASIDVTLLRFAVALDASLPTGYNKFDLADVMTVFVVSCKKEPTEDVGVIAEDLRTMYTDLIRADPGSRRVNPR